MELIFDLKTGPVMLRPTDMCYEICRLRSRTDKNTGANSDSWEPYLYPATLEKGLSRIMDMKIKASDARTLAELKTVVESARDEVCHAYNTGMWGVVN